MRGADREQWPDGRGLIHQPIRFLLAMGIIAEYFDEQEPVAK